MNRVRMAEDLTIKTPPRGRPRDPGKREALIAAARRLFIAHRPDQVTIDQVIADAGVSRATFYAHFGDKGALLEAMCRAESGRLVGDGWVEESLDGDLESVLSAFGERFLAFLSDPDMLGLERLAVAVAASHPDLAPRLFAAGPGRARAALRRLMQAAQAKGQLAADADLEQAVSDLMGLFQGMLRVELNFGQRARPEPAEISRRSRHAVRQFLRLYGTEPALPAKSDLPDEIV